MIQVGKPRGVSRAELWRGGSKQPKIPPGAPGGFGRGYKISYIFLEGGGGGGGSRQPGNPSGYTLGT